MGLKDLVPNKPVKAVIHHAESGNQEILLKHTMSREQAGGSHAGVALNVSNR